MESAGRGFVETTVPRTAVTGQVRVETRAGPFGVGDYTVVTGAIEVQASTPWGAPISGVVAILLDDAGVELDRGQTNEAGVHIFPGLEPGKTYVVQIGPKAGFFLASDGQGFVDLPAADSYVGPPRKPASGDQGGEAAEGSGLGGRPAGVAEQAAHQQAPGPFARPWELCRPLSTPQAQQAA